MYRTVVPCRRTRDRCVSLLLGLIASAAASGNPQGPDVVSGTAGFANPGLNTLQITNSPNAIVNWNSFNIGAGETTRFVQESAASAVLNRVTGQGASSILGQLVSNGHVFLINPSGILIGRDAVIDTAGLVLSTLNMSNADFQAGRLHFEGDANSGEITNHGYIKSAPGGEIVLIAPRIVNAPEAGNEKSGLIESEKGELILAAGHAITITSLDDPDITFEVQAPTDEIVNLGQLLAKGGMAGLLAGTIKHSGEINADALTVDAAGHVVLTASSQVELGNKSITTASGPGAGGSIAITAGQAGQPGRVYQGGLVRADGNTGGTVSIAADRILSTGAVSAQGRVDGGQVSLAATTEFIATSGSRADASAASGTGGTVAIDGGKGVFTSGMMLATGLTGGTVHVLGEDIKLAGALIDTSGTAGGGGVRVGGGFQGGEGLTAAQTTNVNGATVIKADAGTAGKGGNVVVWADAATQFDGAISARGGDTAGNGGDVEVSGKENLGFAGHVDVAAPFGVAGTLLLDPKNIKFVSGSVAGPSIALLDPHPGQNNNFGQNIQFFDTSGVQLSSFSASGAQVALVRDPLDDFGGADAGAVYLYRMSDGALLSALTGSRAGDKVGNNAVNSVGAGANVLVSTFWNGSAGAVTLYDTVNGTSGVVDSTNSLVGASAGDQIGNFGVLSLVGNVLAVLSSEFNGQRGALSFGTTSNLTGVVSAANSLIGSTPGDRLSASLQNLFNGNFALTSANGGLGAVTFINPSAPPVGVVSSANSLVGASAGDAIGSGGVQFLSGSTWAVRSPFWDASGVDTDAGAVTLFDAVTGTFSGTSTAFAGVVAAGNSLVGSTLNDQVGSNGISFVAGNSFAVFSPLWDNTAATASNAGAVTWVTPGAVLAGAVSTSNSLVGGFPNDSVGASTFDASRGFSTNGIYNLFTGNAVLKVPGFNGGAGSITFLSGTSTPPVGTIGAANSLVGATAADAIGSGGLQFVSGSTWAVLSPLWDASGVDTNAGAVTLFDSVSGTFSGTATGLAGVVAAANSLVGSTLNDQIGSNGVSFVVGSTFGVFSPLWDNTAATADAGAVTWFTPGSALAGVVSTSNSLVGGFTNDRVGNATFDALIGFAGNGVYSLFNGNALLKIPGFNSNAGAVTFLSGSSAPPVGVVSAANSLVGSAAGDQLGSGGIYRSFIGGFSYAVLSPFWDNTPSVPDAGAVTIASATTGVVGAVGPGNSLVGTSTGDKVGGGGIIQLFSSGNAVLLSNNFQTNAGAVTFLDFVNGHLVGDTDFFGTVNSSNSLIGGQANDNIGSGGIDQLNNGNFVVLSPNYSVISGATNVGAVTFGFGTTGVVGVVANTNSLAGTQANDAVGSGGLFFLSGGNALVRSPSWNQGAGAVTFLDASTGRFGGASGVLAGDLGVGNSLIGGTLNDAIGSGGIREFFAGANSYYAVFSPLFDNTAASVTDSGAVTFANAGSGVSGFISNANSYVGTNNGDQLGAGAAAQQLFSNGNVVLLNPQWNTQRGAATFVDLVNGTGLAGDISASNSVVGSTADNPLTGTNEGDQVGSDGITELFGTGVFAVASSVWNNGGATQAGALTWGNINTGVAGVVSGANSLVGANANDRVGACCGLQQIFGSTLWRVQTPNWNGGIGALTFFDPSVATPVGVVDATNSLVGSTVGDALGSDGIFVVPNAAGPKVVVQSSGWNNGAAVDAGAITIFLASTPVSGVISAANSLVGSNTNDRVGGGFQMFLSNGNRLFVTPDWSGSRGAVTFWNTAGVLTGTVGAGNSLVGSTPDNPNTLAVNEGDQVGRGGVSEMFTSAGASGRYFVNTPTWNGNSGAFTTGSISTGISGVVDATNSLVGSTAGDRIGQNITDLFFSDKLLITSETWNGNRGAATFFDPLAPVVGAVSASNSLVGTSAGDRVGEFQQLFATPNRGLIVFETSGWNNNSGALTLVSADAPLVGELSASNSLIGRTGDKIGSNGLSELNNGSLIIWSPLWSDGTAQKFGAVTYVRTENLSTGLTGFVSAANSLVGSHANDQVGGGFFQQLASGNLVIRSPSWNQNSGALTFLDLSLGRTGEVSPANSLVGVLPGDFIGSGGITNLGADRFLVRSPLASVAGIAGAGRIDIIDGAQVQGISGDVGFATNPGGDFFVSIQSVLDLLNAGGTLHLQASNDIINPVGGDFVAQRGSLFLQAGRSIEISGNLIVENGDLTLIANDHDGDPAFRDVGEGNVILKALDTPILVMARNLTVDAENVLLEGGSVPGAYAALVGLNSTNIHAHGSGLLSLVGGTDPSSTLGPISSADLFLSFLTSPSTFKLPAAFIIGGGSLTVNATDLLLQGGGSAGAFAALVSFGEFKVDSPNITLQPGTASNTDAVLLGLGGIADIKFDHCTGCDKLTDDPFLNADAQSGIFISGVFLEPSINAILAMLGRDENGQKGEDAEEKKKEGRKCN